MVRVSLICEHQAAIPVTKWPVGNPHEIKDREPDPRQPGVASERFHIGVTQDNRCAAQRMGRKGPLSCRPGERIDDRRTIVSTKINPFPHRLAPFLACEQDTSEWRLGAVKEHLFPTPDGYG